MFKDENGKEIEGTKPKKKANTTKDLDKSFPKNVVVTVRDIPKFKKQLIEDKEKRAKNYEKSEQN